MYKYFDACGRTLGSDLRSNAGGADRAVRQCSAVDCHALYFRAQLVVTTVQPNMNTRRSRAAPQTQCDTAQGNVRPFGAISAAFVCFCPNYSEGSWVTTPHRTMFLDSVYLRSGS